MHYQCDIWWQNIAENYLLIKMQEVSQFESILYQRLNV